MMHSELSEAFEAVRKDNMDDHLPTRTGVEAQLSDAMIRIRDYCGDNNPDIGGAFVESWHTTGRGKTIRRCATGAEW